MPAQEEIEIEIKWGGNAQAQVHFIIDNDVVVADENTNLGGYSSIKYKYKAKQAAIHVIEGSLWFPGSTVRKLVVTASIDGDDEGTVDAKKDDTKNQWSWRGAVP